LLARAGIDFGKILVTTFFRGDGLRVQRFLTSENHLANVLLGFQNLNFKPFICKNNFRQYFYMF
jgi:hypothetical protein